MSKWQDKFPWTASAIGFLSPAGPSGRKRWIRIAMIVLAVVAVHALMTAIAAARTRRVADRVIARWGELDPALHRPAYVEDSKNRARPVRAATDIMALPPLGFGTSWGALQGYASGSKPAVTPAERDTFRKIVADNDRALSLLDMAAERTAENWDLHYERGIEIDVPPLLRIIQLAKVNAAAGRLAMEDGRPDDALIAVRRGSAIVSSLENEPILIVQLVRLAVSRINAALVREILKGPALHSEQLASLQTSCPHTDPRGDIRKALIVEMKAFSGLFRTGKGASKYESEKILGLGVVRVLARPYLLRQERLWLEINSAWIDVLDRPRSARGLADSELVLRRWDVPVKVLLTNIENLVDRSDLAESREGLLHAAIAVERLRIDNGHAPTSFAGLAAVDPLTGRAYAYESDGTGWRVRSEADLTSMQSERWYDPVLDWSHKE